MQVYGPSRVNPSPLAYAKEGFRRVLRGIFLYVLFATLAVALLGGMLEPNYLSSAPWFVWLAPLYVGAPVGVFLYLLARLLRFAFRR